MPVRVDQVPAAERLKSHFTRTLFWECLNRCEIEQTLELKEGEERAWLTSVTLQLIPQHELTYALSSPLSLADLLAYVETKFVKTLCVAITKKYNQIASSSLLHSSTVRDKSMKNFKLVTLEIIFDFSKNGIKIESKVYYLFRFFIIRINKALIIS